MTRQDLHDRLNGLICDVYYGSSEFLTPAEADDLITKLNEALEIIP